MDRVEPEGRRLPPAASIADLRKGLGLVFINFGCLHWGLMIFASLYALGKLPNVDVAVSQWNNYYLMFFVYMFFAGAGYILRKYSRTNFYVIQLLIDFLAGLAVFHALFLGVKFVLVRQWATQWISLFPGLFLLYYGYRLYRGRQIWSGLDLI